LLIDYQLTKARFAKKLRKLSMSDYSFIFNAHPSFIDNIYQQYKANPDAVDASWRLFFEGFEFGSNAASNGSIHNSVAAKTIQTENGEIEFTTKELQVVGMINGYRRRGHLLSKTNPIKDRDDRKPMLDLADYGLSEEDLDQRFIASREINMKPGATLREIIDRLHKIYCGNIGLETYQIHTKSKRRWLRQRLEKFNDDDYGLSFKKKKRILEKLNGAVGFESFLNKKYVGQKRFSLEGGESVIPGLDAIINEGAELGVEEIIIGMAHRGRLNVLANTLGKTYDQLFKEFEKQVEPEDVQGSGDVKYHLGYSSQVETLHGKKVELKLAPNPSHLEAVNTVVEGFARAKADILYDSEYDRILPILIHGDAAIAGQGIVYETVQMSKLKGYKTGGTIHIVINNQVGFTTDYKDARTSTYCTGVASLVEAPVLHVNGDDPEAVVFACEVAMQYRQEFNSDVFIDMVCYRRHGHNEGDEPRFTQPKMYEAIDEHPDVREIYKKELITKGTVEKELAERLDNEFNQFLQERLDEVKQKDLPYKYQKPEEEWRQLKRTSDPSDFITSPETGVDRATLDRIVNHLMTTPEGFTPIKRVGRLFKNMKKLIEANTYDWAFAELMAYGSLLLEGRDVRMSGQDVKRGTFSHRHAVLMDRNNYTEYNRLTGLAENQGQFRIFNSFLSEYGVLGFEFGYSMATPNSLVIWEAQFGDFFNGAQIMVDQFIMSSESKWGRMSGLVMLLPHGFEGQGPEHSSARLERFLQSSAEFNVTVANVTKPANFFHLLRRQLARPFRKPLIVMSPKSLLRYPECVSPIEDFAEGTKFQEVYDDPIIGTDETLTKNVKTVLWCSGKIYYDLIIKQREEERYDVAILRMEQLYPFPKVQADELNEKYKHAKATRWVQEEPSNMGAWQYIWSMRKNPNLELVARPSSASPASGYQKVHKEEQQDIIERAFR
jgi:2-oxoglutarate dehydrogenase E1 component